MLNGSSIIFKNILSSNFDVKMKGSKRTKELSKPGTKIHWLFRAFTPFCRKWSFEWVIVFFLSFTGCLNQVDIFMEY